MLTRDSSRLRPDRRGLAALLAASVPAAGSDGASVAAVIGIDSLTFGWVGTQVGRSRSRVACTAPERELDRAEQLVDAGRPPFRGRGLRPRGSDTPPIAGRHGPVPAFGDIVARRQALVLGG